MFPTNTLGRHQNFLQPKYKKIKRITLLDAKSVLTLVENDTSSPIDYAPSITFGQTEPFDGEIGDKHIGDVPTSRDYIIEILEELPPAFTKDYDYGLGFAKQYRFIVDAIEDLSDCDEIVISQEHRTEIDQQENKFYIETKDFESVRQTLNNITNTSRNAAVSVKSANAYNFLAKKLGKQEKPVSFGRSPLRKLLTKVAHNEGHYLSENEQEKFIDVVVKNVKTIADTRPEKLTKLQSDIELGSLEILIEKYEKMLMEEKGEGHWQTFLNINPFILSMAFGYPIIKVQEKASVGGRNFSGRGDKFTDFLVKNSMTDNTAIVEIKSPQTKLLNKSAYRNGVYIPSADLSGSINQALDQKFQLEREFTNIKDNSQLPDIKSYAVHCCLIIGTMPDAKDQRKSFELFRRNSKAVEIITFDELLAKLKNLRDFLTSPEGDKSNRLSDEELPF